MYQLLSALGPHLKETTQALGMVPQSLRVHVQSALLYQESLDSLGASILSGSHTLSTENLSES